MSHFGMPVTLCMKKQMHFIVELIQITAGYAHKNVCVSKRVNMKYLTIITIAAALSGIRAWSGQPVIFEQEEIQEETETDEAKAHHGTLTSVTTTNMWISDNNKNNKWVIDKEGTPKKKYVVDSPARKEISHYETVNYPAVTHQEPVYSTRSVWYVDYPASSAVIPRETYYDYNQALQNAGARDGNITEGSEQYISSYTTVVDRAAYSQTVKVIDQYAREEKGHYETEIVGEIGHWEQGKKETIGKGGGRYQSKMTRSGAEDNKRRTEK